MDILAPPRSPARPLALGNCAFLLDVDGTILDIAASPRQVWVPTGLRETLSRLTEATGGALALVSGRSIKDLDLIFSPLQLPAIGVHGAEMRIAGDGRARPRVAPLKQALKRRLASVGAELGPGILVEDKGYSLALHFRLAPQKGPQLLAAVTGICREDADGGVDILPGKLMVDIKPAGINKGDAVDELMQHAPYTGRQPIFIGDDTTDVPVFNVMPKFDGLAFSVGGIAAAVHRHFDTPESVRSWLAKVAAEGVVE